MLVINAAGEFGYGLFQGRANVLCYLLVGQGRIIEAAESIVHAAYNAQGRVSERAVQIKYQAWGFVQLQNRLQGIHFFGRAEEQRMFFLFTEVLSHFLESIP